MCGQQISNTCQVESKECEADGPSQDCEGDDSESHRRML
jgi:hypothetical protein